MVTSLTWQRSSDEYEELTGEKCCADDQQSSVNSRFHASSKCIEKSSARFLHFSTRLFVHSLLLPVVAGQKVSRGPVIEMVNLKVESSIVVLA